MKDGTRNIQEMVCQGMTKATGGEARRGTSRYTEEASQSRGFWNMPKRMALYDSLFSFCWSVPGDPDRLVYFPFFHESYK